MLIVSGTIRVDPGKVDELLRAAAIATPTTRQEDGCVAYHFSADAHDAGVIRVYEQWTSKDALDAHLLTEHTNEFRRAMGAIGTLGSDVTMYDATPLGRPTVPPLPDR